MMRSALDATASTLTSRSAWSSTPTTSECRRRSRAASCARTATASSPARRCSATAPTSSDARALLAEAPELGVGVHLALVGGGPVVGPGARALAARRASGAVPVARRRVHRRAGRGGGSTPPTSNASSTRRSRACATAGITVDHLDTHHHLGFLPVVGQAVEAVARSGTASPASAARSKRRRCPGSPTRARGLKAGVLTGLGWLTRRQLGARATAPQSWGYVESGPPRRGAHPGDHRPARPGRRTSSSATRARSDVARLRRRRRAAALTSAKMRRALGQRGVALCRGAGSPVPWSGAAR